MKELGAVCPEPRSRMEVSLQVSSPLIPGCQATPVSPTAYQISFRQAGRRFPWRFQFCSPLRVSHLFQNRVSQRDLKSYVSMEF